MLDWFRAPRLTASEPTAPDPEPASVDLDQDDLRSRAIVPSPMFVGIAVRCTAAGAPELRRRAQTNGSAIPARRRNHGDDFYCDGDLRYEQRSFGMVHWRSADTHLCDIRHDALYGSTRIARTSVIRIARFRRNERCSVPVWATK